jgi:HD-like signal output (HDOD) protein
VLEWRSRTDKFAYRWNETVPFRMIAQVQVSQQTKSMIEFATSDLEKTDRPEVSGRLAGTEPGPPAEVRSKLLACKDALQVLPLVARKALEVANDPDGSIREFAAIIERDHGFSTDVLRIANSVAYAGRAPNTSVSQAAVRLGFRKCKNLILDGCLRSMMRQMPLAEVKRRDLLWQHGYLTGMISRALNRELGLGYDGEEFTCGLFHDLGRALLGVAAPQQMAQADPLDFDETGDIFERERAILQTDHCEVGTWFALRNRLPDLLVSVIRDHHQPEQAGSHMSLVALTGVADDMANHLHKYQSPEGYLPESNRMLGPMCLNDEARRQKFITLAVEIMTNVQRDTIQGNQNL